jgi:hypothetical protein
LLNSGCPGAVSAEALCAFAALYTSNLDNKGLIAQ